MEAMKVVLWNVYNGFQGGPEKGLHRGNTRESLVADHLADEAPDVVCLLELQGFTDERIANLAKRWGHQHYILIAGRFPMAITSRFPLGRPMWNAPDMVHGFISVEINRLRIVLSHIPTSDHGDRSSELRSLLRHLLPILDKRSPLLLLGDLNGTFHDALPTAFRAVGLVDPLQSEPDRIDYILHNPDLNYEVSIRWDTDPTLLKLSDHFPLIAILTKPEDP